MNREYMTYLLKTKRHLIIFLVIIGLFPTFVSILDGFLLGPSILQNAFFISIVIMFLEAIILPFVYFNFLQSKRALDTYYNIPISKDALVITNVIHIYGVILLTNFIGTLFPLIMNISYVETPLYLLGYYVLSATFVLVMILFSLSIIYKTYSMVDSILITIAYFAIPWCIVITLSVFESNYIFAIQGFFDSVLPYISFPACYFLPLVRIIEFLTSRSSSVLDLNFALLVLEMIIIGGVAFVSIKRDVVARKAELSETISNNFFAYPLAIGIGTMCMLLIVTFTDELSYTMIIMYIVIFIAYLILTFIYRRKISFQKKDLILFAVALISSMLIVSVANSTDSLGINKRYEKVKEMHDPNFGAVIYSNGQQDNAWIEIEYDPAYIDDQDTLNDLKRFEDKLYANYKEPLDYNGDWKYYVDVRFNYRDENNTLYSFYYTYLIADQDDVKDIVEYIDILDDHTSISYIRSDYDTGKITDEKEITFQKAEEVMIEWLEL